MGYLSDKPVFHHALLLERGESLWLVADDDGRWTVPGFLSEEQHTAEVELVARRMRARYGLRMSILGTVASDFDEAANCVRKAYLAEAPADTVVTGRWWTRTALAAGEAPLCEEVQALVARWVTRSLSAGDTAWSRPGWLAEALAWVCALAAVAVAASYRRYPPTVAAAHPWMREMPPFCLRRIIVRRAWEEPSSS